MKRPAQSHLRMHMTCSSRLETGMFGLEILAVGFSVFSFLRLPVKDNESRKSLVSQGIAVHDLSICSSLLALV
jgi:hypothetical protein